MLFIGNHSVTGPPCPCFNVAGKAGIRGGNLNDFAVIYLFHGFKDFHDRTGTLHAAAIETH